MNSPVDHKTINTTGFATRAIHHGYDAQSEQGSLTPPIHMTSTFAFDSAEQGGARFAGEEVGHIYTRISNPTLDLLERRLANLEGAEAGLVTASGMGAINAVLWTLLDMGDEVIVDQTLYGCTYSFMHHGLQKFGVTIKHVDMTNPENLKTEISDKTRVVYFETPANPNMRLVDIQAIADIAHENGSVVVVDNTYASPYLTRPLSLGADVVVHSATKYLGGHGDLIAGAVVGSAEIMEDIRLVGLKDMTGAVMSPMTAMLIMRGLKTLELRMDRHCSSALTVAKLLADSPLVEEVFYPGLETSPYYDLAQKQMAQPGGMIAFEMKGGHEAGVRFINQLKMIKCAVSLGDAESLIQHPASMTHSTYTPEERAVHGISEGLIRLSVGLESPDDILQDLDQALDHQ